MKMDGNQLQQEIGALKAQLTEKAKELDSVQKLIVGKDKQLVELQMKVEQFEAQWKRAAADYQNLEKRVQVERQEYARFAAKGVIEKLLSAVDDLEKAAKHLKDQGLNLALKKMHDLLKFEGLEKIEVVGKEFDIQSMEAISVIEGKDENKVVEEVRKGYMMHGSVIRPAQVIVSKLKK